MRYFYSMDKKLKTLSILLGIIIAGTNIASAFGITPWISDIFVKPDFSVMVDQPRMNSTKPIMDLTMQNVGSKQITDVTIHISSSKPIWKIDQICSEATEFSQNSSDYKINFERMSVDIPCSVTFASTPGSVIFNVDAVGLNAVGYHWTIFKNLSDTLIFVNVTAIILLIVTILLAYKTILFKKKRISNHNTESSNQSQPTNENPTNVEPDTKNHKFIESRYVIPDPPNMKVSLDKTEYVSGNDVVARITFSGITKDETIVIETYNPSNTIVDMKRIQAPSSNGYFDIKLFARANLGVLGKYSVIASTQFGPQGESYFFYISK